MKGRTTSGFSLYMKSGSKVVRKLNIYSSRLGLLMEIGKHEQQGNSEGNGRLGTGVKIPT
jgi:hypothetical protein